MNFRLVAKNLAYFAPALGAMMLPSALWAAWFAEWSALAALLLSAIICIFFGAGLWVAGRSVDTPITHREAIGIVAFSWLTVAALGALPYLLDGHLGLVDAYFESMSGFTTAGSTVIQDIEAFPRSLLFWRAQTQWLGGLGIVILFIAVLPYLGAGGKLLFRSEATGPDPHGLRPHIQDTASVLYRIYIGLTVLQTAALMIAGMSFYDALGHTFTTLATGGFSSRQASIAGFDSVVIEMIIIVFMVIAGTNFALYFAMLRGDRKALFRSTEWRVYMGIMAGATVLITLNILYGTHSAPDTENSYTVGRALRSASFQVASIMTSTGYGTDDFDAWPHFSRYLLLLLMFCGGCAGSTSGGLKVIRLVMLVKIVYWRVEATFRPKTVRAVRVDEEVVSVDVQQMLQAHFALYVGWVVVGTLVMCAVGLDIESAVSSIAATMNTIGPGLGSVGATEDFSQVPVVGKLYLCFSMVLGRLELFSLSVFFLPAYWKYN